jgi:sodium transport system permease protein
MIWHVYKKELTDSFRDRKTILLSMFIPIAMMLAMVLVFENLLIDPKTDETYAVAINADVDDRTLEWFASLAKIDPYRADDPDQEVRDGNAVVSVKAEPGFLDSVWRMQDIMEIRLLADRGSMKGVSALETIKSGLGELREHVVFERLVVLSVSIGPTHPIRIVEEELTAADGQSLHLTSMVLPFLVIMAVMVGGQSSAVDLFAGEKERKTMEALLMTPVSRSALILAKWLAIATLGFISGIVAIVGFIVIVNTMTEHMKLALNFGDQALNLVASALASVLLFAMLIAAIQIIFSLFANNFKEAQTYFGPIMFIALLPYFLLMGVGVNELQAYHFLIPVMNTFAFLKELMYGVLSPVNLALTLLSTAATVAVMYAVAAFMFRKDKWVLGK